jgi:hypothetical protein
MDNTSSVPPLGRIRIGTNGLSTPLITVHALQRIGKKISGADHSVKVVAGDLLNANLFATTLHSERKRSLNRTSGNTSTAILEHDERKIHGKGDLGQISVGHLITTIIETER